MSQMNVLGCKLQLTTLHVVCFELGLRLLASSPWAVVASRTVLPSMSGPQVTCRMPCNRLDVIDWGCCGFDAASGAWKIAQQAQFLSCTAVAGSTIMLSTPQLVTGPAAGHSHCAALAAASVGCQPANGCCESGSEGPEMLAGPAQICIYVFVFPRCNNIRTSHTIPSITVSCHFQVKLLHTISEVVVVQKTVAAHHMCCLRPEQAGSGCMGPDSGLTQQQVAALAVLAAVLCDSMGRESATTAGAVTASKGSVQQADHA